MREKIVMFVKRNDFLTARRMLKKHKDEFSEVDQVNLLHEIEQAEKRYLKQKKKARLDFKFRKLVEFTNSLILLIILISLVGTVIFAVLSIGPKHLSWDGFVETNFPPRRQKALGMLGVFFGVFSFFLGIHPIPKNDNRFFIILGIIFILSGLWQLSLLR